MNPEITEYGILPAPGEPIVWPTYLYGDTEPQYLAPGSGQLIGPGSQVGNIADTEGIVDIDVLLLAARRRWPAATIVQRTYALRPHRATPPHITGALITAHTADNSTRRPFARLDSDDAPWRDLTLPGSDERTTWYQDADLIDWLPARVLNVRDLEM
jgi:hypothetical protein